MTAGGLPLTELQPLPLQRDARPSLIEWKAGSIAGCVDPGGDDDVEIVIRQGGTVEVAYRRPASGC